MENTLVLKDSIDRLIEEMKQVEVKTDEEYQFLEGWLRRNKESQKMVAEAFEAERVAAKSAYDAVLDAKKQFLVPLEASEKTARQKLSVYATTKEQARRAEQKRLDDIARKEAEDIRLAEAQKLADKGENEKADALLDKSIRPVVAPVAPSIGKMREVWTVEIVSLPDFLRAVASDEAMSIFVDVNHTALNASAQLKKDQFFMPGMKAIQKFVPVL